MSKIEKIFYNPYTVMFFLTLIISITLYNFVYQIINPQTIPGESIHTINMYINDLPYLITFMIIAFLSGVIFTYLTCREVKNESA